MMDRTTRRDWTGVAIGFGALFVLPIALYLLLS